MPYYQGTHFSEGAVEAQADADSSSSNGQPQAAPVSARLQSQGRRQALGVVLEEALSPHHRPRVRVLALLPSQRPANRHPGRQKTTAHGLGSLPPTKGSGVSSRLLASAGSSPSCCGQLGSESADRRSPSATLSRSRSLSAFPITK